jgi:peptidoglycan/xylan/chitin deacetylase (PgdA/CDA1 family)
VALKVDVDTLLGFRRGVPRLLSCLAERGIRASFYVAMGPDRSGRAIRRVFTQKGFLRKMLRSRALRLYGWRTALYGTLLPAPPIAASAPELLHRIRDEGHELGVHGYDHVHWHDRLNSLRVHEVAAEIGRATKVFRELVGAEPGGFAAPGWQLTAAALEAIESGPFRYHSSTRGRFPYLPRVNGRTGKLVEIPTTLPTLDERLGLGEEPFEAIRSIEATLREGALEVFTIHAEVEGGACLPAFASLLDRLRRKVRFERIGEIAAELDPATLPVCPVAAGEIPGRAGTVACQQTALATPNSLRSSQAE